MADTPNPNAAEIANLKEREAMLVDKQSRIEKMDAGKLLRDKIDINELKQRNQLQLTEVRKEIARLQK